MSWANFLVYKSVEVHLLILITLLYLYILSFYLIFSYVNCHYQAKKDFY